MTMHDDQAGNRPEPLMKPVEELEQRAYGAANVSETAENDPEGMPVIDRAPLPFPGGPYPAGVVVDPMGDEDNSAVARTTPEAEREGERRSGE